MSLLGRYLEESGIKQEAFASKSGVPPAMVSLYASGQRRPGLTYALAIEEATGGKVPASYWTTFHPKPRKAPPSRRRRSPPSRRSA